jgi:hypothetical protein
MITVCGSGHTPSYLRSISVESREQKENSTKEDL